jgi:hypothetical protein
MYGWERTHDISYLLFRLRPHRRYLSRLTDDWKEEVGLWLWQKGWAQKRLSAWKSDAFGASLQNDQPRQMYISVLETTALPIVFLVNLHLSQASCLFTGNVVVLIAGLSFVGDLQVALRIKCVDNHLQGRKHLQARQAHVAVMQVSSLGNMLAPEAYNQLLCAEIKMDTYGSLEGLMTSLTSGECKNERVSFPQKLAGGYTRYCGLSSHRGFLAYHRTDDVSNVGQRSGGAIDIGRKEEYPEALRRWPSLCRLPDRNALSNSVLPFFWSRRLYDGSCVHETQNRIRLQTGSRWEHAPPLAHGERSSEEIPVQ